MAKFTVNKANVKMLSILIKLRLLKYTKINNKYSLMDCWLLYVQRQICHTFLGREQVHYI
jgi:hypothetical protein